MICLVFDILDGMSLKSFLKDVSSNNNFKPEIIITLIREVLNSDSYYIRTYLPLGGEGKMNLFELTEEDITRILFYGEIVYKKKGHIINSESMIFKYKS